PPPHHLGGTGEDGLGVEATPREQAEAHPLELGDREREPIDLLEGIDAAERGDLPEPSDLTTLPEELRAEGVAPERREIDLDDQDRAGGDRGGLGEGGGGRG